MDFTQHYVVPFFTLSFLDLIPTVSIDLSKTYKLYINKLAP